MRQTSLTDDFTRTAKTDGGVDSDTPSDSPQNSRPPIHEHPATEGIAISDMAFVTPESGIEFPHPADITKLTEDVPTTESDDMALADDADPEEGVFLAMDAEEVYDYFETQQKKTDWWLENERKDLVRKHLSQKPLMMSNADKRWIVTWEIKRRAEIYGEWKPTSDTKGWQPLPNADS